MVDPERLRRLLQRMADDIDVLRSYATGDRRGLRADPARLGHVKYLFVTAIEGAIDAAQHVCASEGWGPPESNAEAITVLARHGVLGPELARSLAAAVRFRNLLVHGYARVDDDRVVSHLDGLSDLDAFVGRVAGLIES